MGKNNFAKNNTLLKTYKLIPWGIITVVFFFLFILSSSTNFNKLTTVSAQGELPPTCDVTVPQFKFPWAGFPYRMVYFMGGPHAWSNDIFDGEYVYGTGSGLDFSAGRKSFSVIAMAEGDLIDASCSDPSLGCIVAIKHHIGSSVIIYGHLDGTSEEFKSIQKRLNGNRSIKQGEILSKSGNTGHGEGYHLHIELRDGSSSSFPFGKPIGWECVSRGGQIDGYWIWGYYNPASGKMLNYDGVAVKATSAYSINTNFRYKDWPSEKPREVTTVTSKDFSCSKVNYDNYDCEQNNNPNTQFAKIGNGGLWPIMSTTYTNNSSSATSTISAGVLVSSNQYYTPSADNSHFISDITIQDGYFVEPGQSYTKTWRLQNTGSTTWGSGYQLVFVNGEKMGAPSPVDVPSTAPGGYANISVNFIGPDKDGTQKGYWRMRNPQGTFFGETVRIEVVVNSGSTGGGQITVFDVSPTSPADTDSVHVVGRILPASDFRSMRFKMGNQIYEMPNPKWIGDQYEISTDWDTSSLPPGNYSLVFEVANVGDNSWSNPERMVKTYNLLGSAASNHAPDRPGLKSPYNWYLKDASGAPTSVELCVYPSNDPESNPVTYYFEVKDQGGGVFANSGWISSTCWTRTFDPNTYSWRVKASDGSAVSDWSSDIWNFSVAKGGVYIGSHSFFQQNTNETHMCVYVTYDGIQGPEVYAWINTASDNSENGDWRLLGHYGPNTTPDCTAPNYHGFWIRSPEYTTGTHKIKVSAIKKDSGANATMMTSLGIAHIRPSDPHPLTPSSLTNNGTEWNTRTIDFKWTPSLRAESYNIRVSTNPNPWVDAAPVVDQVLSSSTTNYSYTFAKDYERLYWSVRANNSAGFADWGSGVWFGIDQIKPSCQITPLPSSTYENIFQVNWSGADDSSGIRSYDIQYMDSTRGTWLPWLLSVPSDKTYDLFTGSEGHEYQFRCRSTDRAGNTNVYPTIADTSIVVDLQSRPVTPWWNEGYSYKRNITILNNMSALALPAGYVTKLAFDGTTTPSASDLYGASLSSPKCNDLRIIANDTTELDRIVETCTNEKIVIWFRTHLNIPAATSDNSTYQLYYGNTSPATPLASRNGVFYPIIDSYHLRVFDMLEGTGTILHDSTGNSSATMGSELSWSTSGKFGHSILIPGDLTPEPRPAIYASYGPQPSCNFTVETWIRRLYGHQYGGIIAEQETGYTNPWRWIFMLDGGHRLQLSVEGTNAAVTSNGTLAADTFYNNWHHIAVTHSCSGEVKFYIDGILDSTKFLSSGYLNPATSPLRIGNNAYSSQRIAAYVSGFALSEGIRTEFSYGRFGIITNEPSVMTGSIVNPPIVGSPDLQILDMAAYPSADGSVIIQVEVTNNGNLPTQNQFYTDLYVDHLPTGPEDYSGSIRFWVNESIEPGEIVTLTTSIPSLLTGMGIATPGIIETESILYGQTDSMGVVSELDNDNNIYSEGLSICSATSDIYESDNIWENATPIQVEDIQTHNFNVVGDQDWFRFSAQAGVNYAIRTLNLDKFSDTFLYLYDVNGTTLLASNDDFGNTLESYIQWTPTVDGDYYIMSEHWNPSSSGCGTSYDVSVSIIGLPESFEKIAPVDGSIFLNTTPTLSWETSDSADSYEYCYDSTDDDECTSSWMDNDVNTSIALTDLTPDTTYYWQVRAVSSADSTYANNGVWWSFTVTEISPGYDEKLTTSKVRFDWSDLPNATSYKIQLSIDPTFNSKILSLRTYSSDYAYDSFLKPSKTYYWRIRPKFGDINGSWSDTYRFTSMDPLTAPTLNTPGPKEVMTSNDVTFTWSPVTNAAKYQIQVARDLAFTNVVAKLKTDQCTQTITLSNGMYFWRVRAIDASGGKGPWSGVRKVNVNAQPK